jgi:chromosome segregation ATPase
MCIVFRLPLEMDNLIERIEAQKAVNDMLARSPAPELILQTDNLNLCESLISTLPPAFQLKLKSKLAELRTTQEFMQTEYTKNVDKQRDLQHELEDCSEILASRVKTLNSKENAISSMKKMEEGSSFLENHKDEIMTMSKKIKEKEAANEKLCENIEDLKMNIRKQKEEKLALLQEEMEVTRSINNLKEVIEKKSQALEKIRREVNGIRNDIEISSPKAVRSPYKFN